LTAENAEKNPEFLEKCLKAFSLMAPGVGFTSCTFVTFVVNDFGFSAAVHATKDVFFKYDCLFTFSKLRESFFEGAS